MKPRIGISAPVFSTLDPKKIADSIFREFEHWEIIAEGTLELGRAGRYIGKSAEDMGATLSVHLPMSDMNIASLNDRSCALSIAYTLEQMDLGHAIGAKIFTVHTGSLSPLAFMAPEEAARRNMESLEVLADHARGLGVVLALENLPMPHWFLGARHGDVFRMLDALSKKKVGWCFDIGHANTVEGLGPFLRPKYLRLVRNMHLHDNKGKGDDHLPLGKGDIDIRAAIKAVLAAGGRPAHYIIESRNLAEGVQSRKVLERILLSADQEFSR